MIQLFIFDLDGVITDTAEYHYLAWSMVFNEEKLQFSRQNNEFLKGLPRIASLHKILELNNVRDWNEQKITDVAERKNQYYKNLLDVKLDASAVSEGTISLLESIRSKGYYLAVASSSKNARYILSKLDLVHYFNFLADGNLDIKMKPFPDIFLYVACKLNIEPADCIVFEDAQSGINAARSAGMITVGIDRDLNLEGCDLNYKSLSDFKLAHIGIA